MQFMLNKDQILNYLHSNQTQSPNDANIGSRMSLINMSVLKKTAFDQLYNLIEEIFKYYQRYTVLIRKKLKLGTYLSCLSY